MYRPLILTLVLAACLCRIATADWPLERIELTDGRAYEGFIESEDSAWVYLAQVHRPKRRAMFVVIRPVERSRISRLVRLDAAEKEILRKRLESFRNRARIEAGRMEAVELKRIEKEGNSYQHYQGKLFALDSTADELTTRRMVVRVDQVFTAYRQILSPRDEPVRPLRLVVLGSVAEYAEFLSRFGLKIENSACYIRDTNLIVASSEIARFATALDKVKQQHDQLRRELDELETRMQPRLKALSVQLHKQGFPRRDIAKLLSRERVKFEKQIEQKQKELSRCDRQNARKFDEITRLMFHRLHHETFHAYLENYVYPHKKHDVPLWLNEGLATMFEQGQLESDTLRVDAPNPAALKRLKDDLSGNGLLSVESVINARPKDFVSGNARGAERHYAYCWGLVYYLTFERGLLQSESLERYVAKDANGRSAGQRFEQLVGMPLQKFEQQWREYILKLKP
jgi:hypothetical protein